MSKARRTRVRDECRKRLSLKLQTNWHQERSQKKRNVQTGHLCLEPCRRCHKLMFLCYNQVGGKACIHCARSKIKCVEQGVEDGYMTEVIGLMERQRRLPYLDRPGFQSRPFLTTLYHLPLGPKKRSKRLNQRRPLLL